MAPNELNTYADSLANEAMNRRESLERWFLGQGGVKGMSVMPKQASINAVVARRLAMGPPEDAEYIPFTSNSLATVRSESGNFAASKDPRR